MWENKFCENVCVNALYLCSEWRAFLFVCCAFCVHRQTRHTEKESYNKHTGRSRIQQPTATTRTVPEQKSYVKGTCMPNV